MTQCNKTIIVNYNVSDELAPQVILRTLNNDLEWRIAPNIGDMLNWWIHADRYCVGYHGLERGHSYLPCPDHASLSSGIQCMRCKLRDALLPCIVCDGRECRTSDAVKKMCSSSQTSIYLASFGRHLKVGVSDKDRLMKRWLEQGTDEGIELAVAPNARLGRIIEGSLSKEFSIPKSTRIETKIHKIFSKPTLSTTVMLEDTANRILKWIEKSYPECKSGDMKVVDLTSIYQTSLESTPFSFIPPNEFILTGKFLGMKGPLFFFESNAEFFLDFRGLRGQRITVKQPLLKNQLKLTDWSCL